MLQIHKVKFWSWRRGRIRQAKKKSFKIVIAGGQENSQGFLRAFTIAFLIVVSFAGTLRFFEIQLQQSKQNILLKEQNTAPYANFLGMPAYAAEITHKPYAASLLLQPRGRIYAEAGDEVTVQLGFKNTGQKIWKNSGGEYVSFYNRDYASERSIFEHDSWLNRQHTSRISPAEVYPGHIGFISFTVSVPQLPGTYRDTFQLAAEDTAWIDGGTFVLEMEVSSEIQLSVPSAPQATQVLTQRVARALSDQAQNVLCESKLSPSLIAAALQNCMNQQEPNLRVGLYYTARPVVLTNTHQYRIVGAESNTLLFTVVAGESSTVWFIPVANVYTVHTSGLTKTVTEPVRFESDDVHTVFEITTLEQRPAWNRNLNDNRFRGKLEFRHAAATGRTWIINELPVESYLKGLAESSQIGHVEYQKALVTAARTYALWHYLHPTKHANENFIVDATYDQVYRGYGVEIRLPKVTQAVEATRGKVVAYNNELVVTPYYSRSDGRTRGWTGVWGGATKPWLASVMVPQDSGKTLFGHGVGMSAQAAAIMAQDEGKNWSEILKHFYSGIELRSVYR